MANTSDGRFVWYELMTTDSKAAVAFYTGVVGWKTQPFDAEHDYLMWVGSQGPLGGTMTLPKEAKATGTTPHWTSHVHVSDVDATVRSAQSLGGRVLVEPTDLPGVGRFSSIADPEGATICVFKAAQPMAAHDVSKPGEICWAELATTDHPSAFRFYAELFGWTKLGDHDMGPMGTYLVFGAGTTQIGGMFTSPKGVTKQPAWLYYIEVPDLDGAIAKAKATGAQLLTGPVEVPGGARIAQLKDPQGAAFALHSQKPKA